MMIYSCGQCSCVEAGLDGFLVERGVGEVMVGAMSVEGVRRMAV